ncbi:hypothetical protein BDZ94DRAFT_1260375 [Collybia nuda]|uniref:Protein kinase domain-containing protein n=1 Tax=Collybia nuda TaxID=64659 RepID=A0A9P5Y6X0_9AGAR|nr:hypothetical protein BDZ94DRAFT_1260375 [Collybia nuda]
MPISKLVDAFNDVHHFLQKQVHRPFLKRYLKRDEILKQIDGCDQGLGEALGMFSLSIQIRILKQVQKAEVQRQADTQALLNSILNSRSSVPMSPSNTEASTSRVIHLSDIDIELTGLPPSSSHKSLAAGNMSSSTSTVVEQGEFPFLSLPAISTSDTIAPLGSPSTLPPSQILPTLRTLHSMQNSVDAAHDMADLRGLMRAALSTSSDAEMLHVLQIGKEEMPEALKTLQRALERVNAKAAMSEPVVGAGAGVVEGDGKVLRRVSVKRVDVGEGSLQHSKTVVSLQDSESSQSAGSGDSWGRDTLDQEFLETGIEALRRMSNGVETTLPSWTITRYECDREQKIGIGFFSDVYKGKWRGRAVAIKVLAESTPRDLFVREISIWKTLKHPHVLELCGASSASGDPPWFFVSPYLKNGSLVEYLKKLSGGGGNGNGGVGLGLEFAMGGGQSGGVPVRGRTATFPVWSRSPGGSPRREGIVGRRGRSPDEPVSREADLYRFMQEIAKGMEYLHQNGVLHGDLKAANVLVDDKLRCVISDFGQSEMKSEAYRISGTPPPHGTLRWQAPELMSGLCQLTAEMDVYAYAILCIEILTMGRMPWALMDDEAVRHFVLKENSRPPIPNTRFNTPALQELLRLCWHNDPAVRPPFATIVKDVRVMRKSIGQVEETISPTIQEVPELWEQYYSRPSPDMRPSPLPIPFGTPPRDTVADFLAGSPDSYADGSSFRTAREQSHSPPHPSHLSHLEETVSSSQIRMPVPVFYTPSAASSRASSLFTHTPSTQSEENLNLVNYEGYDSPPPADERLAEIRNERRYRMLLSHQFHPSLTLPLWGPSPVSLGAVGYLSKPDGSFVTLFNALNPEKCVNPAVKSLPSVYGYGRVSSGSQRQDKRNAAQRGLDAFVGLLTFKSKGDGHSPQNVGRRYSFPLRAGHKSAYMCTETTMYRYAENLEAPKKWFKANVDTIMQIFGAEHRIQKEDLFLVIGTLDTPDYALFVSHTHPDGQVHFNVFSSPKSNKPWGMFTTDTEVPPELGGPSYDEPTSGNSLSASKVSDSGGPWDTVLLARLRFKPDALDPTSL